MKSYLNLCIIRGLIAVLKMGVEEEAAELCKVKKKDDSCVFSSDYIH